MFFKSKILSKLQDIQDSTPEDGFTLIELMIVVVIIGILAAIAIPVFANQQKAALITGVKSDVKNTNTNIVTELISFPTASDINAIGIQIVKSDSNTAITMTGSWTGYIVTGTNTSVNTTTNFNVKYSTDTGTLVTVGG